MTDFPFAASLENSILQTYRIHRDDLVEKEKLFLADGIKVVERLIQSNYEIREIICLEKYISKLEIYFQDRPELLHKIFIGTEEELKSIRGYDLHQGIMAVSYVPTMDSDLQAPLVILNGVLEANNIGSIIRSAVALGVNHCLLDEKTCHPFIRRSVRVSMGTILKMNFHRTNDLKTKIKDLQKEGVHIVGTSLKQISGKPLENFYKAQLPSKSAIILGNEAYGVDSEILELANQIVYIPMKNGVDSLNVAVSGAIFLSGLKPGE